MRADANTTLCAMWSCACFGVHEATGSRFAAMTDVPEHDHEIKIKGGAFALSDLGELMPGMAEIMPLVGGRIWKCYYAGKTKNRVLATFQLKKTVNLLEKNAILRPKYEDDVEEFVSGTVATIKTAIDNEDWDTFEAEFATMIELANDYHEKYDKGYLHWKMPDQPPPDLDLSAT